MAEIGAIDSPPTPETQDYSMSPKTDSPNVDRVQETQSQKEPEDAKMADANSSVRIWPPSQKIRDGVLNRLIETLSTPSLLTRRYGTIPPEEARDYAKTIEEEAYGVASAAASAEDDGIEILQLYSKEISMRMIQSVKARCSSGKSTPSITESETKANAVPVDTAMNEEPSDSMEMDP